MGAYAAGLFHLGQFGTMTARRNGEIVAVSLSEVAGRLKTVPLSCDLITEARLLGIRFGDEAIP
jgi:6-phosphofructokinase 1